MLLTRLLQFCYGSCSLGGADAVSAAVGVPVAVLELIPRVGLLLVVVHVHLEAVVLCLVKNY